MLWRLYSQSLWKLLIVDFDPGIFVCLPLWTETEELCALNERISVFLRCELSRSSSLWVFCTVLGTILTFLVACFTHGTLPCHMIIPCRGSWAGQAWGAPVLLWCQALSWTSLSVEILLLAVACSRLFLDIRRWDEMRIAKDFIP